MREYPETMKGVVDEPLFNILTTSDMFENFVSGVKESHRLAGFQMNTWLWDFVWCQWVAMGGIAIKNSVV